MDANTPTPAPEVRVLRVPGGGVQPQVAVDGDGVVDMVYLTGPDNASDIYFVHMKPGDAGFSRPIRVNSVAGSAIAIGTVRGPQIAIGRGGRVYVAWDGSSSAQPRGPGNQTPMLFARMNKAGTAFEPQLNVMHFAGELDGGGSVAADQAGNVYVVWHGNPAANGEANRRVWVARSRDDGKTFEREFAASPEGSGACGCCGLRAFASGAGTLYIFYRAAREAVHRDMTLLVSKDAARTFVSTDVAPWELRACPMSTAFISQAGPDVLIAWQTEEQVYFGAVSGDRAKISAAVPAAGEASDRKHPIAVHNSAGLTLFAWTEGTGWKRGGSVAWQLYDPSGKPYGAMGTAPGLPVWGMVAAYQGPGGSFNIVY